jgi:hypothetical protein
MARTSKGEGVPAEPTFAAAQSWWSTMRQPVTFIGVPGHPLHPTVLWNAGLLFCSNPREYQQGRPRLGSQYPLAPGLSQEWEGYELDALQLEFSFGAGFHLPDRLDSTAGEIAQELLDGRVPVVVSRLKHDGILWTGTVLAHATEQEGLDLEEQDLLTEVRWTAENTSTRTRTARLSCHLTCPHLQLGYKVRMEEQAQRCLRALSWEGSLVLDDRRQARLAAAAEGQGEVAFFLRLPKEQLEKAKAPLADLGLAQDVVQFQAKLAAGESVSFRIIVPFNAADREVLAQALRRSFDGALRRTRREWESALSRSRLRTPEPVINDSFDAYLAHAMLATGRRVWSGNTILKCSPNNYEGVWSAHSAIAAYSMDLRGEHDLSRRVFETFLDNQGPLPAHVLNLFGGRPVGESEGFSAHPGFLGNIEGFMAIIWAFYHGWILWAIGQHARLTGDWKWLRGHADKLALACDWIEAQRRRTRRRDARGEKVLSYGLLPAANAFDWGFGHMFWSDAHTYRGLREMAGCLRRLRYPRAKEYLAQAEDYRTDIVAAVSRSRDASPPVPLDDGSSLPFVPMSVEMRDYFAPDWTYVGCGPLNLAWAGVVPADHELIDQVLAFLEAGRPLGAWDAKREKYQGWDWGVQTPADEDFLVATRPRSGRCYLWRHKMTYEPGWIPQAFTFLLRDDMPALLEHLYSLISDGGQHVALRTPIEQRDGVAWTQPGDANLLWLMRSMLVREEGDRLILAGSCPRAWLGGGESIEVERMPTHFGPVSYRLTSHGGARRVTGSFQFGFRARPQRIRLRLRHPEGKVPSRVTINGRAAQHEGEWIEVPASARTLEARLR